jgi:hypothetical protein
MPKYPDDVAALLAVANGDARSTGERGKAYEDLACLLFDGIPGIDETVRNRLNAFQAEEVDVAVSNLRHPDGLRQLPEVFLIECKNWSVPVGSIEVSYFASRIRNRGCTFGVLIAAKGVTGNAADLTASYYEAATALKDGVRMVVITGEDIARLTSDDDFILLLRRRFLGSFACGTFDMS